MSLVKGLKRAGFIEVNQPVKFTKAVQAGFVAMPWGTAWYVDGTNGDDTDTGLGPSNAKATIQSAVTAATGGDVIYIRPLTFDDDYGFNRYTEDVEVASGISSGTFVNAGMSLIGVTRPGATGDFLGVRWTHETATALTNNAPALALENIGFFSESATYGVHLVHDGATGTKQGSQGTSFFNCAFKGKGVYTLSGGDGLTYDSCRFQCSYGGTVAEINHSCSANPGRRLTIRNCEWLDGNGTASSGPMITIAPPCTEILIRDCHFPQKPTSSGNVYISMAGANEGMVSNCYFGIADLDTDAEILQGTATLIVACYDVGGLATTD